MKKIILLAVFMIAAGSLLHAQQQVPGNGNAGCNKSNTAFIDANKNKVCDNYEYNHTGKNRRSKMQFNAAGGGSRPCSIQGGRQRGRGRNR